MKWCLQKDFVPSIVVGVKNLTQLQEALQAGSTGWSLSEEQVRMIRQQYACTLMYATTITELQPLTTNVAKLCSNAVCQMSALNEASEPTVPDTYKAVRRWYQERARALCK